MFLYIRRVCSIKFHVDVYALNIDGLSFVLVRTKYHRSTFEVSRLRLDAAAAPAAPMFGIKSMFKIMFRVTPAQNE